MAHLRGVYRESELQDAVVRWHTVDRSLDLAGYLAPSPSADDARTGQLCEAVAESTS
jgi:hypothetical protein